MANFIWSGLLVTIHGFLNRHVCFEYYAHKDEVKMPNTRDDLYNHVLLGASYVELYKGGAGFKAVEFKYIQHDPEA